MPMDGSCVQHINVQKELWKFKQTVLILNLLLSFLVHVVKMNIRFRRVIFKSFRSNEIYFIKKHCTGGWGNAHVGNSTYCTSMMTRIHISEPKKKLGMLRCLAVSQVLCSPETEGPLALSGHQQSFKFSEKPILEPQVESHRVAHLMPLGHHRDAHLRTHIHLIPHTHFIFNISILNCSIKSKYRKIVLINVCL